MSKRVIFVSGIKFGYSIAEYLLSEGFRIDGMIQYGKKRSAKASDGADFSSLALSHNIPIIDTDDINSFNVLDFVGTIRPYTVLVMGWSQILGPDLLRSAKYVIGSHPTLLPHGRGRAPIPWTIINNKHETGLTFFILTAGVDLGPIIIQREFDVGPCETSTTLYDKMTACGKEMAVQLIRMFERDEVRPIYQHFVQEKPTAARRPEDSYIDPSLPQEMRERLIRAATPPYPRAFTIKDGTKYYIRTGDDLP